MADETDNKEIRGGARFRKWGFSHWNRGMSMSQRNRRRAKAISIAVGLSVTASMMFFSGVIYLPEEHAQGVIAIAGMGIISFMAVSLGIATAQILYDTLNQHISDETD